MENIFWCLCLRNLLSTTKDGDQWLQIHCILSHLWGSQWMKHCDPLGSVKKQSRTSGLQKWYSCLNELRSITDGILFTAVTATATTSTKRMRWKSLMKLYPVLIEVTSHLWWKRWKMTIANLIILRMLSRKYDWKGNIRCRYNNLLPNNSTMFHGKNNLLANKLGNDMYLSNNQTLQERLIEMMHSQTVSNGKDHVLQQFSQRWTVGTIAFGMGVNCQGVRRVIHFGPSKTIEYNTQ